MTVIEVRKAKESNWKKSFQSCKIKRGKGGKFVDQGISQEAKMINDIQKKKTPKNKTTSAYLTDQEHILQRILATK